MRSPAWSTGSPPWHVLDYMFIAMIPRVLTPHCVARVEPQQAPDRGCAVRWLLCALLHQCGFTVARKLHHTKSTP